MKKLLAFIFVLAGLSMNSQTSCATAGPFCAGGTSGVTFPATTNQGQAPTGPDYGCLYTTPNPAWYYLQVGNSGSLDILIAGQQNGGPGQDVDFICWGPFSSLSGICNSLTATYSVDCSYSPSYTETLSIANGISGQYYLVLITNYANVAQNIEFTQISGTGNTNCAILQANNSSICAGSSATIHATNSASLTSPTYSLNPGGVTSASGNFTVSPTATTIYTLFVTGINSSNSIVTQTTTATVSVNPQPSAAPTLTQSTCTNSVSSVDLHLSFFPASPVPSYTVTWSSNPPTLTSATQQTVTNIPPLPYTVTVTAAGGCSIVSQFTVNPQPAPANFTIIPFGSIYTVSCAQPTLILDASNASFNYTWTNGSSAPVMDTEAAFTSSTTGTWSVNATNPSSGCTSLHTFTVVQNFTTPTGAVTPSLQNITCVTTATTITLTANTPTSNITHYIIGPNNTSTVAVGSQTALYVPGAPGAYRDSIVITSTGCSTIRNFTVLSSDLFPTLGVTSPQQFTVGCGTHSVATMNLSGNSTNNSGATINYALLFPAATNTNPGFTGITNYTTAIAGTYTAMAVDPTNSCVTRVPFSIIANNFGPDIHANVPLNILSCNQPSTVLTAITANTLVTFMWSYPGPNGIQSVANPTLPVNTTTNVNSSLVNNYTLTITDLTNGCLSTLSVNIQQNQYPPKAGISGSSFSITCAVPNIQLNNNSFTGIPASSGFPTNQGIVATLWQGPTPQAPATFTPNYQGFTPGIYTLTVKDMNNGCTSTTTQAMADNRIYPVIASQTPAILDCGSAVTTITALVSPTISGAQYNWTPPADAIIAGSTTLATLQPKTPGMYRFVVTNPNNGCASAGAVSVTPGILTSSFAADHITGFAPLTVNFSNNSNSSLNTSSINTVWTFGNGTQTTTPATSISPSVVYTEPGNYVVTIFTTKGSCQSAASITITVDIPSKLEIPNIFTPNGDGVNDIFFVHAANLTEITAKIYDRWGRQVYELVSNTGNIAWDGKNEVGKEVSAGTYFYIITATGKDGQSYNTKGTVTLLK